MVQPLHQQIYLMRRLPGRGVHLRIAP